MVRVVVDFGAYCWGASSSQVRMQYYKDFGNTNKGDVKDGLSLAGELDMGPYEAPTQYTHSKGLHYIFYDDGEQAKRLGSITWQFLIYYGRAPGGEYAKPVCLVDCLGRFVPTWIFKKFDYGYELKFFWIKL